ncbi:MAG TPA: HAD hydrolase-like protein [Anaerolineae bacterium]|nr:HAD hydrolase-like protein [Anaerolineae bacterium]
MNNIKVVIFDCDGVMFDTAKANTAYYNSVLRHFKKPDMTPEQFAYSHMHTADEAMAYLFDDENMFEAAQTYRKNMSYLPFLKDMEIEPYLKPLLKRLRPRYKTAVATNRADTMKRVLIEHNLKDCFDLVVSALDVKHPKPHPEQLIKILKHFNIAPYNAIYIGDSKLDEMAAKAAEMTLIAYKNRSISADFHINGLKEIEDIIEI